MVRILVVEDDALIRAVAIDVLEDAGFAALEAENAMEAISVLGEHAEDIAACPPTSFIPRMEASTGIPSCFMRKLSYLAASLGGIFLSNQRPSLAGAFGAAF